MAGQFGSATASLKIKKKKRKERKCTTADVNILRYVIRYVSYI